MEQGIFRVLLRIYVHGAVLRLYHMRYHQSYTATLHTHTAILDVIASSVSYTP
jgi:hypothetical protein